MHACLCVYSSVICFAWLYPNVFKNSQLHYLQLYRLTVRPRLLQTSWCRLLAAFSEEQIQCIIARQLINETNLCHWVFSAAVSSSDSSIWSQSIDKRSLVDDLLMATVKITQRHLRLYVVVCHDGCCLVSISVDTGLSGAVPKPASCPAAWRGTHWLQSGTQ